jgi:predicted permease
MGLQLRDGKYALRVFKRNPGFAAITVAVLALGIGAATAIFTVFSALMLRPLPLPHPEQLVEVSGVYRLHSRIVISYPMFAELDRDQRGFSGLCAWSGSASTNVEINGTPISAQVRSVTGNYFSVLGEQPLIGRLLSADDVQGNRASPVAVISYEFWRKRFGGDPRAAGKTFRVGDRLFTVIGVTHRWFSGVTIGNAPEITIPVGALDTYDLSSRSLLWLSVTGRLKDGVTLGQARSQLQAFWPRLLEHTVPTQSAGPRRQAFLSMGLLTEPVATGTDVDLRANLVKPLSLLLGIVGLMLLLVCINLASLTLARSGARHQEIGTRIAFGATPWQAVRQLLLESLLLSSTGALLGLAFAYWGSEILVNLMTRGTSVPILLNPRPDWRVLCFSGASALFTGIFIGVVPAWRLSRQSPAATMREGQRTMSRGIGWLGKVLIVSQIAISMVLIDGAGLFLRSLQQLRTFDPGFERNGLTEVEFAPLPSTSEKKLPGAYRQELADAIAHQPGVQSAAFTSLSVPAGDSGWKETVASDSAGSSRESISATLDYVSPGLFRTLKIPLLAGRDFAWTDDSKHPRVAIIDSLLAQSLFLGSSPIGRRINFGVQPDFQSLEIIGIAQSARLVDLRDGNAAVLYVPAEQFAGYAGGGSLLLRGGSTAELGKAVGLAFQRRSREYAVTTRSFEEKSDDLLVYEQMIATLSSFFAALALLVSGAGLFGLMWYAVTLRTREIGIRMALGSQRADVLRMILCESVALTFAGIVSGIPCALILGRLVSHMLFGLTFTNSLTLAGAIVTLLASGIAAGYLPARRAMKIEPMVALRQE